MSDRREVANRVDAPKEDIPQKWYSPIPLASNARQYTEIVAFGTITGVTVKLMGRTTNEAIAMGLLGGLITFYWTHSLKESSKADIDAVVDHHPSPAGPPTKPNIGFGDETPKAPLY